jgi:hypothetical protein
LVRFHADLLNDIENQRIRADNRYRSLTRDDEWGKAIPEWHPHVAAAAETIAQIKALEKDQIRHLAWAFQELPTAIVALVADTPGLGEKSAARWLGLVGDPGWHPRHERPRRIRELYSYCGLGVDLAGKAPRNRKGQQSNWNNMARTRLYVMAESGMKMAGNQGTRSPYRDVYEAARERYEARGDDITKGHLFKRAMRIVMKQICRDFWTAATQALRDSQSSTGGDHIPTGGDSPAPRGVEVQVPA